MAGTRTRTWAYALTVAGGALIVTGAVLMMLFYAVVGTGGWSEVWWTPGHHRMIGAGIPFGLFALWGLIAGTTVLWAGVRVRPGGPGDGTLEGIAAIVGSVLSFPVMGGFMFGALFGVAGGALSLAVAAEAAAEGSKD